MMNIEPDRSAEHLAQQGHLPLRAIATGDGA